MTTEPTPTPAQAGAAEQAPNPFAGIPMSELIRDGAAFLLLVLSLGMRWKYGDDGPEATTGYVAAILVTILSILSISLTYLGRARVFGAGVSAAQVGLFRAAANLPYILVVVAFLLMDLFKGDEAGGVGFAASVGLTAVILVALPRKSELPTDSSGTLQAKIVRFGLIGLAGLWSLASVINLFILMTSDTLDGFPGQIKFIVFLNVLPILAGLGLLAVGFLRGSQVARLVAIVTGGAVLGAVLLDAMSDSGISGGLYGGGGVDSAHFTIFGIISFLTIGAIASSPVARESFAPLEDAARYVRTAQTLFFVEAALLLVSALSMLIALTDSDLRDVMSTGKAIGYIFVVVVMLLMSGAVVVTRVVPKAIPVAPRLVMLAMAGGLMLFGLISMLLLSSVLDGDGLPAYLTGSLDVGIKTLVIVFGFPIAIIVMLTVPASMRASLTKKAPVAAMPPAYVAPVAAMPPAYVAPVAAPVVEDAVEDVVEAEPEPFIDPTPEAPAAHPRATEASDPATSTQDLFDIASSIPELRAAVAANPSTYPDLVAWLGKLGDPAVDAALAARGA